MAKELIINNLEDLAKLFNDKNYMEVVTRRANKRFKEFINVSINKDDLKEDITRLIKSVVANTSEIPLKDISRSLETSASLSTFNAVLGIANLATDLVGFTVINEKLKSIQGIVEEVSQTQKTQNSIEGDYKFRLVLSEYKAILDIKKYNGAVDEERYRQLIDNEAIVAHYLISAFTENTTNNKTDVLYSILSLLSMMAVTIADFDRIYFYNHKDKIPSKYKFHDSRKGWLALYDHVLNNDFIICLQDLIFIEEKKSQYDTDLFIEAFIEKVSSLKQDVLDNGELIEMCNNLEVYNSTLKFIDKEIVDSINNELTSNQYSKEVKTSVKESCENVGFYYA